ncbi:hypothetical protein Bca101_086572 [Brassica carinata]
MIDAASTSKSTPSSSNNHYKADMAPLTALQNIYALMQCTPDLSSGDCDNCLRQSARDYQSCCASPPPPPPPEDDQARTTNNADSDILTPQSSQYDFKTIEAATNKFSRSNKLGEGGFDEVDKARRSLHRKSKSAILDSVIQDIIGGIIRGLLYFHQDSQLTIIHRDFKAINILLDANIKQRFQILDCLRSLQWSKLEAIPGELLEHSKSFA